MTSITSLCIDCGVAIKPNPTVLSSYRPEFSCSSSVTRGAALVMACLTHSYLSVLFHRCRTTSTLELNNHLLRDHLLWRKAMCVDCLRTKVDISEGIPKQAVVYFCKSCERYLKPPNIWVRCELESKELLALLLKKLKGLGKVHMIDAGFIWTEPHSRRLKVKLTIQKEVDRGAILQQVFVVEYVVHTQMCDDVRNIITFIMTARKP